MVEILQAAQTSNTECLVGPKEQISRWKCLQGHGEVVGAVSPDDVLKDTGREMEWLSLFLSTLFWIL